MNNFRRSAFLRIAAVTVTLSTLAAPVAWWMSRENAVAEVVAFAQEESHRLLANANALDLSGPGAPTHAAHGIEPLLPKHGRPAYTQAFYESLKLPDGGGAIYPVVVHLAGETSAAPLPSATPTPAPTTTAWPGWRPAWPTLPFRPYKEPLPFKQVMAMLAEGRGRHFDPAVLACFEGLAPELRDTIEGLDEAGVKRLMADMIERHFDAMSA